jgi:hypothetical protein
MNISQREYSPMRFSSNPYHLETSAIVSPPPLSDMNSSINKEEAPEQFKPTIPDLLVKVIRNYKKSVNKIIYNQDKSRFALVWKTVVQDIEINFYDNLT